MNALDQLPLPALDLGSEVARPRLLSILFCDWSNQTIEKKINLIGIFDSIKVSRPDGETPPFTLYLRMCNVKAGNLMVDIFSPSGDRIGHAEFEFQQDDQDDVGWIPNLQTVTPMFFASRESGMYWFAVSLDGEVLGGAGLRVERLNQPLAQEDQNEDN